MSKVFKRENYCSYDPTKDKERDPYENLAFAIVFQAVEDYKDAVANKRDYRRQEILDFFKSGWCMILTDLDMEVVTQTLDKRIEKFIRLAERQPGKVRHDFDRLIDKPVPKSHFPRVPAFRCPICRGHVSTQWGNIGHYHAGYEYGWIVKCETCKFSHKMHDKELDKLYQSRG